MRQASFESLLTLFVNVETMYLMLQQEQSDDYEIATGESYKLAELIEIAFRLVGLDWREYVGQ